MVGNVNYMEFHVVYKAMLPKATRRTLTPKEEKLVAPKQKARLLPAESA